LRGGAQDNVTAAVLRLPGEPLAAGARPASKPRRAWPWALLLLALIAAAAATWLLMQRSARPVTPPAATPLLASATPVSPTRAASATAAGSNIQIAAPTGALETAASASATPRPDGARDTSVEPTLVPTFTPRPTRAPNTPTARPAATLRADTPAPGPTGSAGVILRQPPAREMIRGSALFAWDEAPGFALKATESYELIIWKPGQDPLKNGMSPVEATPARAVRVNLSAADATDDAFGRFIEPGDLFWGIALRDAMGQRTKLLSEARAFVYEPLDTGGGSQPATAPPPSPTPSCTGPGCK
jgi:hypothetical protein